MCLIFYLEYYSSVKIIPTNETSFLSRSLGNIILPALNRNFRTCTFKIIAIYHYSMGSFITFDSVLSVKPLLQTEMYLYDYL